MQETLVIIAIMSSAGYLAWFIYDKYVRAKKKCEGCAVHKFYTTKQAGR